MAPWPDDGTGSRTGRAPSTASVELERLSWSRIVGHDMVRVGRQALRRSGELEIWTPAVGDAERPEPSTVLQALADLDLGPGHTSIFAASDGQELDFVLGAHRDLFSFGSLWEGEEIRGALRDIALIDGGSMPCGPSRRPSLG